jgi:hypothetical protein
MILADLCSHYEIDLFLSMQKRESLSTHHSLSINSFHHDTDGWLRHIG